VHSTNRLSDQLFGADATAKVPQTTPETKPGLGGGGVIHRPLRATPGQAGPDYQLFTHSRSEVYHQTRYSQKVDPPASRRPLI